jgi:hypothetical protein
MSAHPDDALDNLKWQRVLTMDLLGNVITHNCCPGAPFKLACKACWSSFFQKLTHERFKQLSGSIIAVQIDKYLLPIMRARWVGWPFAKTLAGRLDALQNRLIGALLNVPMLSTEDLPRYVRRRAHLACSFSAAQGLWSTRWAADIKKWDCHCRRNTSGAIWTAALLRILTATELQQRRAAFSVTSRTWTCFAGRTDTRAARGNVQPRREDSIIAATAYLVETATARTLMRLGGCV